MNEEEYAAFVARNCDLWADRSGLLDRAQELLEWLRAHPNVPISSVEVRGSVSADHGSDGNAELAAIADAAGLPVTEGRYGLRSITRRGADDPAGIVNYTVAYDPSWGRWRR